MTVRRDHRMSDQTFSSRPDRMVPGVPLGIDEGLIRALVDDFYARVRSDPAIGPIFKARVENWEPHLETMRDFWSSVVLMSGRYKGKPIEAHMPLGLRPTHFFRWLHLFEKAANDTCPPHAAQLFIDRAHKIARSLHRGLGIAEPSIETGADPLPEILKPPDKLHP